ncbi:MAG: hypothetical protein IT548_06985 [Alphaproteobacteria bacterium]|nr:hypothetical protein [Alphaproteobacteria bacterium]
MLHNRTAKAAIPVRPFVEKATELQRVGRPLADTILASTLLRWPYTEPVANRENAAEQIRQGATQFFAWVAALRGIIDANGGEASTWCQDIDGLLSDTLAGLDLAIEEPDHAAIRGDVEADLMKEGV